MSYSDLKQKLYADIGVPTGDGNQNVTAVSGYEGIRQNLYRSIGYEPPDRSVKKRSTYINNFLNDADSFFRSVDKDINSDNGFDAAEYFAERQKQADSLKRQADIAGQYLDQYGDTFDQKDYDYLRDYLSNFNTNVDDVLSLYHPSLDAKAGVQTYQDAYRAYKEEQAKKGQKLHIAADMLGDNHPVSGFLDMLGDWRSTPDKRDITDQWTAQQLYNLGVLQNENPEDAIKYARSINSGTDPYQEYLNRQQEEQEMLSADLTALDREIADIESRYWNYTYDSSTPIGEMAGQRELQRMEQEISDKKQYYNKAKRLQDGARMAAVAGNADFGEKSGYVSTKRSGISAEDPIGGYADRIYEYINNTDGVRDYALNKTLEKKGYNLLTEEEVGIYNYFYATEGREKAEAYLETLEDTLNNRKGAEMFQRMEGNTARELLFGVPAGLNQFGQSVKNYLNFNDEYIAPSAYQYAAGMVRDDLADVGMVLPDFLGGGSMGQVGFDLINTTANMAPSILASMAVGMLNPMAGKITGTALMGASAAGSAYQEALNQGYDKGQARLYSALVGASESGLEYLIGGVSALGGEASGAILEHMLSGVDNAFKRAAFTLGGNMVSEGIEEGLQEVLTPFYQNLALRANENVNWDEVAYSTLLGALSGGLMEGPNTFRNAAREYRTQNLPAGDSTAAEPVDLTTQGIRAKVAEDGRSRIITTNESVDTQEFAEIKNGAATIKLKDGNTASMDDLNFATPEEAARFMTVKSLPGIETEAANDLLHAMEDNNTGSDLDTLVGVREAYGLGYYGFDKTDTTRYGTDAAKLSPALRTAAFEAGQKQRGMKAETAPKLSQTSVDAAQGKGVKPASGYKRVVFEGKVKLKDNPKAKAEVKFMDFIADNFSGTTVHVYQSFKGRNGKYYYRDIHGNNQEAPNGRYLGDEIWIDLNSGDKGEGLALNTFAHEMYHHVEKWNQKGAQKLAEFVVKELGLKDVKSAVDAQIQKATAAGYGVEHFKSKGMTEEQAINTVEQRAMSDFVADSLETMFSRGDAPEAIARLKQEDRGLFDKIKEFIDEWVTKLKDWYSDKTISQEGKKVAQLERFEELQKLFLEAVAEAGENYNAALADQIAKNEVQMESVVESEFGGLTDDGMFSYRGTNKDGIEVYETSEKTKNLTWSERKKEFLRLMRNEYRGRTAKFIRNGHAYYAKFEYRDVSKNIYGDDDSDPKGKDAKINVGADGDIFELVENSKYSHSEIERGKNQRMHRGVTYWDYFIKTVQIDGAVFDLTANIRKKPDGEFVYNIEMTENKKTEPSSPQDSRNSGRNEVPNSSVLSINYQNDVVNPEMNSLRNAPENIHSVRQRLADAFDSIASTVPEKNWAAEYREKIAQAETIDSNLKITNRQIQEKTQSKNPADKKGLTKLKGEATRMRNDLDKLNRRIHFIESLKSFRDTTSTEAKAYGKSMLQQMRNQQKESLQQQLLENRVTREELTGKDSDITIMEREFIRIVKKYEQLDAKTGKKITDLRNALKSEADSHREESRVWQMEFNRLLREYETSGRKIERLEATIARQRATASARVQGRRNTELRHKIQRKANELNNLLINGTKHRNIPEYLQPAVAEILNAINMEVRDGEQRRKTYEANLLRYDQQIAAETDPAKISDLIEKRNEYAAKGDQFANRVAKLKEAYKKIQEDKIPGLEIDEGLSGKLDELFKKVGDTPLGQMTSAQLDAVNDVLNITKATISNANKLFREGQRANVEENSQTVMAEVRSAGGEHKKGIPVVNAAREFWFNNLKPVFAFEAIGSNTLTDLFKGVRQGEDTLARDLAEAKEFYRKQWDKHHGKNWDMEKKYRFESTSGNTFELDLNQIMSLYALSKRDQARGHLRKGGFAFESGYKTKEELKVLGMTLATTMESTDASAYNLSDEILGDIIGKLSADQKAFVDEMQNYLSNNMADKGNEVSLRKYGIRLFKDQNYFPLRVADQYMAKKREQQAGDRKLKNSGFTKDTVPEASNPVVLGGFTDVWAEHVDEMSLYHSFVLPLDDLERVLNYHNQFTEEGPAQSVMEAIRNAYGEGASKYIDQLIRDINGGARADGMAKYVNQTLSKVKKAQTMASLSVAIQQPSSILRATSMIDGKYFIGPKVTEANHKYTWAELKKYAPLAIIKEMGGFDVNVGQSAVDYLTDTTEYTGILEKAEGLLKDSKYRDDVMGRLPALMDELSWGAIWQAVKREQKDLHPNMDVKSEAFLKKCGNRFEDIIVHTQVYDSVFSRSAMMRSKDTGIKALTSYMAEPTTTANMLYNAMLQAKRGGSKAQLGRTVASLAGALVVNSALVSLVYAMRDDDEEKRYDEKWIENFRENVLEGLNPVGYLPVFRDISSMAKGFDVKRMDMSLYGDVMDAIKSLPDEDKTPWQKIEAVTGAVGNMIGVPVKNILRDGKGIFSTLSMALDETNRTASKTGYLMAATGRNLNNGEQLLLAIQSGDEAHWTRVAERFDSLEDAVGALKSAIGSHYKDGSLSAEEAKELLMTYADMEEEDVYWKFEEWSYAKDKGNTENYTKFGALHNAIESGEDIETEINRYVEHGTEISTIRSDISRVYKKQYLAAEADRGAIRDKVTPAYIAAGLDEEEIQEKFRDWDFEAEYGMGYSEFKGGYLDDTVSESELREAMRFYGRKNYQIESDIRSMNEDKKFRDRFDMSLSEMKDAYDDGDISRNQLIAALEFTGMTKDEARKEATERDIENRLGIDYMELDDAYKHGDIGRTTLYNAMIEHGATNQEADEAIVGYDWLKKHVKQHPDLTISDGKKFAVSLGSNAEGYTLEDYGVSISAYKSYKTKLPECKGVDANGDGKTDSGTKRDSIFRMIDSLPISDEAKDGLALMSYSMNSIRKNAPWH